MILAVVAIAKIVSGKLDRINIMMMLMIFIQ